MAQSPEKTRPTKPGDLVKFFGHVEAFDQYGNVCIKSWYSGPRGKQFVVVPTAVLETATNDQPGGPANGD